MNYAIILAGGTGRRIPSTKIPKQFVRAEGRMMVTYALEPLLKSNHVDRICVMVEHEYRDLIYADAEQAGLEVVTVDGDDRNFRVATETDLERYMQLKRENRE